MTQQTTMPSTEKAKPSRCDVEPPLDGPMTPREYAAWQRSLEAERRGELVNFDEWYQRRLHLNSQKK